MSQLTSDATTEALIYLAHKNIDSFNNLINILFLADKCSLLNYGRFISDIQYFKSYAGLESNCSLLHDEISRAKEINVLRPANLGYLSDSDIECLNRAANEWQSHGQLLNEENYFGAIKIGEEITPEIIARAEEDYELLEYLRNPHP